MISRRARGFTLVEIMIVVAIIALLAVVALPSFLRARQRSRDAKFINALRIATDAFQIYATEHNAYPPDAYPGVIPPGMESYFGSKLNWSAPSPIGGTWDWDNGAMGIKYGVSIDEPAATDEEMQEIDAKIDDGDINTGSFRHFTGRYTALIE